MVGNSIITVKLMNATGAELASVAGPHAAGHRCRSWTPTAQGAISIYGKVILTGDVNTPNDESPLLNISVQPEGVFSVTIGEGNLAEGVPYEFYYRNSLFQTLYYSTEMGMFGNITAISFYNNFVTDLVATPIKLWLGTTTNEDLSAGWVISDQLVCDGTMNFPSGAITITILCWRLHLWRVLVLYANRPCANYYSSPTIS